MSKTPAVATACLITLGGIVVWRCCRRRSTEFDDDPVDAAMVAGDYPHEA
ncbi:MAG: hypothetical protein ACM3UO_00445 [Bacillota bacterium]